MVFSGPFASPKLTLANAKYHIGNLLVQIQSFINNKPWTHLIETDAEGTTNLHKIRFTQVLSEHLPSRVFDAANNLRAVLDQAGYAAATASGISNPKRAFFPVADDERGLEDVIGRKRCKDIPPEILTLFRGFKPYKGGNDAIWALNRLANTKKHAVLTPIGVGGFALAGGNFQFSGNPSNCQIGFWWDADKNEVTFIRAPIAANVDYNTQFEFSVTFDHTQEVCGGQHPVAVLNTMASEVERILMATEGECRRLGFLK